MRTALLLLALVAVAAGAIPSAASPASPADADVAHVGPVEIAAGDGPMTSVRPGEPAIDLRATGASGINTGMRMTIGDPTAPSTEHAFELRNTGDSPVQATIRYAYHRPPPGDASVSFAVVDAAGQNLVDRTAGSTSWTLGPGATAYVVVTIDTNGATPADDLSGTLTFGVTEDA